MTIVTCTTLGAVTTVAVAWACAAWLERTRGVEWVSSTPTDIAGTWRWNISRGEHSGTTVYRSSWLSHPLEMSIRYTSTSPTRPSEELIPPWTDFLESVGTPPPPGELHRRAVHASGWPCLSMWWGEVVHRDYGGPAFPERLQVRVVDQETRYGIALDPAQSSRDDGYWPRALPLAIITRGFAIDTLIFSVSWFVLVLTPFRIRRKVRRYERGHCPRCVFALRGDYTHPCPECGWQRKGARMA